MSFRIEPVTDAFGNPIGERYLIDDKEVPEALYRQRFLERHVGKQRWWWKPPPTSPYPGPGPPVAPSVRSTILQSPLEIVSFGEFVRRWNRTTPAERQRMLSRLHEGSLDIDPETKAELNEMVIEA